MKSENIWPISFEKVGKLLSRFINIKKAFISCLGVIVNSFPNEYRFCKWRNKWWRRRRGLKIDPSVLIARGVFFQGEVSIGEGSSISDNCLFNGSKAGISIGKKVMIAPNCVFVAFDHGFRDLEVPMIDQPCEEAPIIIDDDVWIAANCTITKGVRLGKGCVVGANSVVIRDVEPFTIVGGVPAGVVGTRKLKVNNKVE